MDKIKVLIVDDEQGIRDLFVQALEGNTYQTLTASDGEAGLEIIKKEKPNVIFLDLKLPGIDGIEALKRISAMDIKPIVIMITGHGTVIKAARAMDLGAYDYIVKPFKIDEIIRLMEEALKIHKLEGRVSSLRNKVKNKQEKGEKDESESK